VTYEEILATVLGSSNTDWNDVRSGSATFLAAALGEDQQDSQHTRLVYMPNVAIGLAWGITANDAYVWSWVEIFSDPSAYSFFVDVLFHGQPIDRRLGVLVDAGRAVLPSPLPTNPKKRDNEAFGWAVPRDEVEFFQAIARIKGDESTFDTYLQRAGFTITA
jgi:hypothetical protein